MDPSIKIASPRFFIHMVVLLAEHN